ncbi:MAG: Selenocysteine-specific translation elongation factor [Candidatus Jettenia ecosi]|uniref:Selenocysteine-specific elongation factor n=1 Tax=Candidatus Jettenia ecosi TaxID=2494326 RepID=A0A533QD86_9BACT|nr:MAG: Selenocysteine-specific translation elongation factor [Candidatus Jettenia ecosi]
MEQSTNALHTEHIIIGTAGHIDHGKTSLVKALTGIDADRLPEEKQRGLTIDIGFAYLDLNSDYRISIVDVPGHERFVKNMLAGATSINLVLFVIAADDGVMPQTVEHLEIINLLGIQHGIVVVTKKDLVTDEWLEVVQEDIKRILTGTTLEHAPVLPVSTITGEGIESCKAMIKKLITQVKVRGSNRVFRLPIDRSFTISGYGCVVTGPILGGQISVDNEVEILPLKKTLRVRGIEVTGEQVHTAFAGQRAAINLTGIKSSEVKRGYELSIPGYLEPANLIDATLKLIKSKKNPLKNRTRIRFHSNTSEVMGRIILLDRDILKPGEESCIQIFLENLITTERNDRFIIRSYSPAYTIGGGVVLRSNTTRLKRFKEETLKILKTLASGNLADIVEQIYSNNSHAVLTSDDISRQANIHPSIAADITAELVKKGSLLKLDIDGKGVVFHRNTIAALREEILHILRTFHKENPLKAGIEETYLKTLLRKDTHPLSITASLSALKREKTIKVIDGKLSLKDFKIELSAQDKSKANKIEEFFLHAGFTPPSPEEVYTKFGTPSKSTMSLLAEQKKLIAIENNLYFHTIILDKLKEIIKEYIRTHGSINVAQFRDLTKTSRKFAVPLMEYFDAIHFTRRTGDVRILL